MTTGRSLRRTLATMALVSVVLAVPAAPVGAAPRPFAHRTTALAGADAKVLGHPVPARPVATRPVVRPTGPDRPGPAPQKPARPPRPHARTNIPGPKVTRGQAARVGARFATGYWVADRTGGVGAAGGAPDLGGLPSSRHLAAPVVGIAASPGGTGYWLVTASGVVYALGMARSYGSMAPARLGRTGTVVGMAATSDERGYWLVSSQGGVYSFGDAKFYGPAHPQHRYVPVVAMAAVPQGGGYWTVSALGQVTGYGDATDHGSATAGDGVVVGMAPTANGKGYWLVTRGGAVLPFGDAGASGPAPSAAKAVPVVGVAAARSGSGYWVADSKGATYGYGPVTGTGARALARGAVAIVADPAKVSRGRAVAASPGARVSAGGARAALVGSTGQAAADFALAQVGKPYVYGATGPAAYDCSGLAMVAWATAGVHLPRTAAGQYAAGLHVALDQLEPGDLVFWAYDPGDPSTIHHVAISLGGDETVQATRTGETVQIIDLWAAGLVPLATRP